MFLFDRIRYLVIIGLTHDGNKIQIVLYLSLVTGAREGNSICVQAARELQGRLRPLYEVVRTLAERDVV